MPSQTLDVRIVRLVFSLEGQLLPVSAGILLPLFVEELLQFACPLQLSVLLGQLNLLPGGWKGRGRGRVCKDGDDSNKSTKIIPTFLDEEGLLALFHKFSLCLPMLPQQCSPLLLALLGSFTRLLRRKDPIYLLASQQGTQTSNPGNKTNGEQTVPPLHNITVIYPKYHLPFAE